MQQPPSEQDQKYIVLPCGITVKFRKRSACSSELGLLDDEIFSSCAHHSL